MSDVKCLVSRTSKECKSAGARKLRLQASHSYARLSGRKILHEMNSKSKCRKYILSLMDIFSRFHWLAPIQRKLSLQVDAKLDRIFVEYGSPERIQSDNGGEFKKEVIELRIHCLYLISYFVNYNICMYHI